MPNPMGMGMGMGMSGQMQPPQGNNPWPSPMEGLRALLGIVDPGVVEMNAFNDQGQFNPMGALQSAGNMGTALVGMADLPGKRKLAGMAGRMMNRGGDDLARAMGGYGDNAAGSIRGNVPPRSPDPMNLGAMDDMAPPGGGAPPGNRAAQDWNNWWSADLGPDDFANYDDWMRHQDYMQQGPEFPNNYEPTAQNNWGNPGGARPPMSMMASSGDPAQLIQKAALEYIQQGVSPAEAIQAATLQFSDLLP